MHIGRITLEWDDGKVTARWGDQEMDIPTYLVDHRTSWAQVRRYIANKLKKKSQQDGRVA